MLKCFKSLIMIGLLLICCSRRIAGDWDVYEECNTNMQISDSAHVSIGVDLNYNPEVFIDSMAIEVSLEHDKPSNLEIMLVHDVDTLLLWDNNYPGGTQVVGIDTLEGQPVSGNWMLCVFDDIVDGNEGWLKKFTLMIRY
jgi:subtilisin-like proprotein convertase family protein